MGARRLLGDIRRLGLLPTLSILRGNLLRYGWRSTLRKMARRFVAIPSIYLQHVQALERQDIAAVDTAGTVFGSPSVLIVASLDLPQCKKYRVLQKVELCQGLGWSCHYASYHDEARVLSYLQLATTLIVYRVPDNPLLDNYLAEARRLGLDVLYDIDDPIFDEQVYRENRNLEHLAPHERDGILAGVPLFRAAMAKADGLILSTSYLAGLAAQHFQQPVYVWRNLLDGASLSQLQAVNSSLDGADDDRIVLAYASGSRAHEADFRVLAQALVSVMAEHQEVDLRIIGYADVPGELEIFRERIEQRPFSSYQQYLQALGSADACLVPLLDDRFNACKSGIRFLEAAACKVPVVASPVGQFSELITDGGNGLLAATAEQWQAQILALVQDAALRARLAEAAFGSVMAEQQVSSPNVVDVDLIQRMSVE